MSAGTAAGSGLWEAVRSLQAGVEVSPAPDSGVRPQEPPTSRHGVSVRSCGSGRQVPKLEVQRCRGGPRVAVLL